MYKLRKMSTLILSSICSLSLMVPVFADTVDPEELIEETNLGSYSVGLDVAEDGSISVSENWSGTVNTETDYEIVKELYVNENFDGEISVNMAGQAVEKAEKWDATDVKKSKESLYYLENKDGKYILHVHPGESGMMDCNVDYILPVKLEEIVEEEVGITAEDERESKNDKSEAEKEKKDTSSVINFKLYPFNIQPSTYNFNVRRYDGGLTKENTKVTIDPEPIVSNFTNASKSSIYFASGSTSDKEINITIETNTEKLNHDEITVVDNKKSESKGNYMYVIIAGVVVLAGIIVVIKNKRK